MNEEGEQCSTCANYVEGDGEKYDNGESRGRCNYYGAKTRGDGWCENWKESNNADKT